MRHTFVLLCMAAFVAGLPAIAHADNPPGGSYLKTCAVQSFRNSVLTANCQPENGPNFRTTQIDTRACGAEIFNRDGGLQCYAGKGWGSGRAIPRGSYIDTCKDVIVTGDQKSISAQCKDGGGNYHRTQLSTGGCRLGGGLDNDNGNLVCRN
jgi:CVNH domain